MASDAFAGFEAGALRFLRGLKRHNERPWFEAHRAEYERGVRDPMRALVEEMDVRLAGLAPELIGDPRRSMFRIHRDVRFSRDKSPYKTNASCRFFHRDAAHGTGQDAEGGGAGFYFQIAPGECFAAAGLWMPPKSALDRLREALVEDHEGFEAIVRTPAFRRLVGTLDEESMLVRTPRGFAPDHPAANWLRYRSFTVTRPMSDDEALGPRLPARLEKAFRTLTPFVRWLNAALGYRAAERR
jgi:uncharacterized protein (TIGR02453 family)